jgi:hypothetical protein
MRPRVVAVSTATPIAAASLTPAAPYCTLQAAADPEPARAAALTNRLAVISEREIFEYQELFDHHHEALYWWDVWTAGYLIGGGCSDDAFIDFRRISGLQDHGHTFHQDYRTFRSARPSADTSDMGENFDFEDPAHMRAPPTARTPVPGRPRRLSVNGQIRSAPGAARESVLETFHRLGATGEGTEQFRMAALGVTAAWTATGLGEGQPQ